MGITPINCPMNLHEYLLLAGIGDKRMRKHKPWEITAATIVVAIAANAIMLDRLGDKW